MTFQGAFDHDNLRRVQVLQDAKCHLLANGSQQNAQRKAYSCLQNKLSRQMERVPCEKTHKYLVNREYRYFCPSNVVTKWRV